MNKGDSRQEKIRISRRVRVAAGVLAMLALPTAAYSAPGFLTPDDYRLLTASGKFDDTHQFAAAFRFRAPRPLKAHRLELAVGTLSTSTDAEAFLSLGPVWRLADGDDGGTYVDFGLSPTLLSGTEFDDRDIGGHFHFTSSLAVGTRFGRNQEYSIAIRGQHTSNGGLNSENPGLDMIGLNFGIEFSE